MISIKGFKIVPTMFPDNTSQVWHLPKEILEDPKPRIDWRFEAEREIFDIFALRRLLHPAAELHVPFLPFSRQDKTISNNSTFNLRIMADFLNALGMRKITTVDVHNDIVCRWVRGLDNVQPHDFHLRVFQQFQPDFIVFPDFGAAARYSHMKSQRKIVCDKLRNNTTGQLLSLTVKDGPRELEPGRRLLIVDDICDGGATFIKAAECLRKVSPGCHLGLAVTHGIFSKGRDALERTGFKIFTTNSLPQNAGEFEV